MNEPIRCRLSWELIRGLHHTLGYRVRILDSFASVGDHWNAIEGMALGATRADALRSLDEWNARRAGMGFRPLAIAGR